MLEIKLKAQGTKWRELEADDRLLVYQSDIQSRAPYAMAQNSSIFRDHFPVFFAYLDREHTLNGKSSRLENLISLDAANPSISLLRKMRDKHF